jgi:hypothetical protein
MTKRQIAALFASAFLVALISLPLVACDGDGGGNGGGGEETPALTDVPRTTCKPAEPVVLSTPTDLPQELIEYQSPDRGYRVRYPSDWKVQPNTIAVQNIAGDSFFTTAPAGEIKPNISISCETLPIGTTSQQYADAKRDVVLRLIGKLPDIEKTLTVDGKEAFSVKYAMKVGKTPEPVTVEKIEVFFTDDLGGWTIGLTAPQGTIETYRTVFDAFVQSFRGS